MKNYLKYTLSLLLGLFVFLISCKTQPPDLVPDSFTDSTGGTDTSVVEDLNGPADTVALQLLGGERARAEAARSRAQGLDAGAYFPEDWDSAENRYDTAGSAGEPASLGEARNQADEWGRIAAAYDDLYQRSIPQFAEDRKNELLAARDGAINAGAQKILPDRFGAADGLASSAQDKYDNEDYDGALAAGVEAYGRYNVLKTIADAYAVQQEADSLEFFKYDPDNYDAALSAGNNAMDLLDQGSLAAAQRSADESVSKFNLVLENGWVAYTDEKNVSAREVRQAALDVKANVAVRDMYQNADKTYNQAFSALRAKDYRAAVDLFDQSEVLFKQSWSAAVDKRVKAEEAIRQAEKRVFESEEKAKNAQDSIGEEEE
jgi:hypothetical protein